CDVARQLVHLLPTERAVGEQARDDRVAVSVEETLSLDAEDARSYVVIRDSRAEELAHYGLHEPVADTDLFLHDDVEPWRGLGHLARHQLAEPRRLTLVEEADEKRLDMCTQSLLGRCVGCEIHRRAFRGALLGVLDDRAVELLLVAEMVVHR